MNDVGLGIGIKLDKNLFFDRKAVHDALKAAGKTVLGKIGFLIRRSARQSMKRRKKKAEPGQPPSAHSDKQHPLGALLKDRLFYYYDSAAGSVVVGPEKLGKSDAPGVQEFGNPTHRWIRVRGKRGNRKMATSEKQKEAYIRLCKEGRIPKREQELKFVPVQTHEHPFMAPALDRESPGFAALYKDQVKAR